MAAAEQQAIPKDVWMKDIPKTGIMIIKRHPNPFAVDKKYERILCGVRSASGPFFINRKLIETGYSLTSRLAIQAESGTMIFDLSVPERRELYGILALSDQFQSHISKSENEPKPGSPFYWENPNMQAEEWMKNKDREIEIMNEIKSLSQAGLERLGLWFKITGGNNLVKFNLLKRAETEIGRQELCDLLFSPDREIKEIIAAAESKGDATKKTGLWRNPKTGIYHWGTQSIGLEKEAVINYLKKDTELQFEMRSMYIGGEVSSEKPPKQAPEQNIIQRKGYLDINKIKADFDAGMSLKDIGKKYPDPIKVKATHWKTIQTMLIEIGVNFKK